MDEGKLNLFYSYRYSDKFLSINQLNYFFCGVKNNAAVGYLAVMSEKKKLKLGYLASLNQKQKSVIIAVLIFPENDGV